MTLGAEMVSLGMPQSQLENAAMNKVVYHIHDVRSLADKPMNEVSWPDRPQAGMSRNSALHSIEEGRSWPHCPLVSRILDLPYEALSSSFESLSQRVILKRMGNKGSANVASSSSPLSGLPISMFKALFAPRLIANRRQTRSVTSRNGMPGLIITLWPFYAILDSRVKGEDVEYMIKRTKGKPAWRPSLDLRDTPKKMECVP
ncbi:hypothetical protein N0V93_010212 [Gnomoniopsis smithogilvyi]|uniref:Uncharacterized protein n=1 Tax=Gnomoniopsis smithogilvyi TaxID=1191159 RepID=A0A9W9CT18_9PEZI|nr:hypothetical protein N0V93_010212 [Gnomoniopsis smithogilvyi]